MEVETRYRTETRTGYYTVTDSETGATSIEEYEYEVQVPYDYYICTVTLENFNLSHLPVYMMDQDHLSLYASYMSTLGNRPDLFAGSYYVDRYYAISTGMKSRRTLEDEQFAAMIQEAENPAIRMSGAAARPAPALTAPVLSAGSSITAVLAGTWAD